ncbi:branched-chain amino acid ABC transporter permease [Nocardioides sediminis]|uniref:branched-chain amino acid ABC transporter permease n=1 Tax=Nocardioides sediminis TaxID=433648 RepID=UPI000D309E99|nr:branched-chain amino acid ABC transporter permease [Nocardioides sediminis]
MQELINAVSLGCIYMLFAMGMSLVWGTLDVLNFAHGSIFMFSAFSGFYLMQETGNSLPLAALLLVGVVVGALMSVLAYQLVLRPILRRAKDKDSAERQILIGGIGLAGIPVAIVQIQTLSNPFSFRAGSFEVASYDFLGARISNIQIVIWVVGVLLGTAVVLWLRRSRSGLALRSIGVDSEVASLMGIDQGRLGVAAMAVAGGMAGLSGALLCVSFGALTAESGDVLLLKAFAIIILGGVGSMLGTIIGAFFLAGAETLLIANTSGTWVDAVSFGLLFLVLLVRPQGILGRQEVRRT